MNDSGQVKASRRLSWKSRLTSSFVLGLSAGVLIGIAVAAPLLGWHLSPDASTVLSAFFGGVAGVAGAVLIWRLQEQSQRQSIHRLVTAGLVGLKSSAENAATGYGAVPTPIATYMTIDISLRPQLSAYADMWGGLGVHQSAFDIAASHELVALKRHVDSLIRELNLYEQRRDRTMAQVDFNDALGSILVRSIISTAGSLITVLQR